MNRDVQKILKRILKDIQVEMSDEFDKTLNVRHSSARHGRDAKALSVMRDVPY